MKSLIHNTKQSTRAQFAYEEQGMSMVIALMMGMILTVGISGLMMRQLMTRKLGAAESYQQMAETAALNGFNRILGELNDNNNESYKGYLYTLDHHEGDPENSGTEKWGWKSVNQQDFPLKELCTDRSQAIQAVPSDGSTEGAPLVDLTDGSTSQRSDGKANIKLQYRLRGYYSPGIDGFGEGSFQVEGVVLREGEDSKNNYLARTLLLRSLYVQSIVVGEGDWAVLAGQNLNLGDTQILGDGKVLLDSNSAIPYQTATGCLPANLLNNVNASPNNSNLENKIIPVFNKGLPPASWWDLGLTHDKRSGSDKERIWSFDDQNDLDCGAIICSRDLDNEISTARTDLIENDGAVIRLKASEICQGSGSDCHIFLEHLNLNSTRLLIETSSDRPVIVHLEYPGTSTVKPSQVGITGSINLSSNGQLCGVNAGDTDCNDEPEQLVILSSAPKPPGVRSCLVSPDTDQYVLKFEGNSLPSAVVHLLPGIVKTGANTNLNGLIWADGICTNSGEFSLITDTKNSSNLIRDINELWGWSSKGFAGYGQTVIRGIRGTGLDTFRRW
ncbi:hypothetical protein OAE87_01850 [bacterium]|nr:hypothetical protein [bacterium]